MKGDVFKPGSYVAIPKALLASDQVSPAAKLVWASVVGRFGDNDESWPGAGTIAKDTGLTRRGVQLALATLSRLKLLTVADPRPGRGTCTYRLTEFASAIGSLAHGVSRGGELSAPVVRTECATAGELSAPELPNGTTEGTTQPTTQGAASPRPASPAVSGTDPAGLRLTAAGPDAGHTSAGQTTVGPTAGTQAPAVQPPVAHLTTVPATAPAGASAGRSEGEPISGPAATPKARRRAAGAKPAVAGKGRPAGLSDDQMRLACSSPPAMVGYLAHGAAAIGLPASQWANLEPGKSHWAPKSRDLSRPEPEVGTNALAAWYWSKVSAVGAIRLPDWGKLGRTVKAVRERMTHEDFVAHVGRLVTHWPAILAAFSWRTGSPLRLDELTLLDSKLLEKARDIEAGGVQQQQPFARPNAAPTQTPNYETNRYANLF